MHITIFGAGGRTGTHVVQEAVKRGHTVTAFIYNESLKKRLPGGITSVVGNVLKKDDVTRALQNTDAVISVVGHIKDSDPRMQTKGIKNIIDGMKENNISRVLSLTGTGVRIEGDTPSLIDRFLNLGVRLVDPDRVKDGIEHAEALKASGLNWTILRVLKLSQQDKENASYTLTEHGPAEYLTSRKKVAKALLDITEKASYIQKLPVISRT